MNQKERLILKILQSDFPLSRQPFYALAKRLQMEESALVKTVRELKQKGFIRRIGAVVSSKKLGYKSVLIGAKAAPKNIKAAAAFINSFKQVTHNYLRDDEYNLWFTYSAKTGKEIKNFLQDLHEKNFFADILALPAKKTFKINTEFKF